jgi:hypothetical protein
MSTSEAVARPRYVAGTLLPPMTIGEVLAFAACLLAVQVVGLRLDLGAVAWGAMAAADVLVWFAFVPRAREAARRRTAIATGAADELWLP